MSYLPPSKGDEIRELKKSKPDKATIQPHIDALIALKTQYKDETGKAYVAPGATANASSGGGGGSKKQSKKARHVRLFFVVGVSKDEDGSSEKKIRRKFDAQRT